MAKNEDVKDDRDPLDPPQVPSEIPAGLDRRKFIMRSAVISAAAVMTGCSTAETEKKGPPPAAEAAPAAAAPAGAPSVPLADDLHAVMKEKGPVLTTVDEFYKVGPGPSARTIGPMRYHDFYQRAANCPPTNSTRRRSFQVNLFGNLSATARDTARNEPRSPAWSGKNRPRWRSFSTASATIRPIPVKRQQVHQCEPEGRHLRRPGRLQAPER
jgi:hypothetical protein